MEPLRGGEVVGFLLFRGGSLGESTFTALRGGSLEEESESSLFLAVRGGGLGFESLRVGEAIGCGDSAASCVGWEESVLRGDLIGFISIANSCNELVGNCRGEFGNCGSESLEGRSW